MYDTYVHHTQTLYEDQRSTEVWRGAVDWAGVWTRTPRRLIAPRTYRTRTQLHKADGSPLRRPTPRLASSKQNDCTGRAVATAVRYGVVVVIVGGSARAVLMVGWRGGPEKIEPKTHGRRVHDVYNI